MTISCEEELDAEITSKGMDGTGREKENEGTLNPAHTTVYLDAFEVNPR